jgi:hypothetical protein
MKQSNESKYFFNGYKITDKELFAYNYEQILLRPFLFRGAHPTWSMFCPRFLFFLFMFSIIVSDMGIYAAWQSGQLPNYTSLWCFLYFLLALVCGFTRPSKTGYTSETISDVPRRFVFLARIHSIAMTLSMTSVIIYAIFFSVNSTQPGFEIALIVITTVSMSIDYILSSHYFTPQMVYDVLLASLLYVILLMIGSLFWVVYPSVPWSQNPGEALIKSIAYILFNVAVFYILGGISSWKYHSFVSRSPFEKIEINITDPDDESSRIVPIS